MDLRDAIDWLQSAELDEETAVAVDRVLECLPAAREFDGVTRMDLDEFLGKGFLQEANRQFFHRHGLALEVITGDSGDVLGLGGVWDYRQDPEGIVFADIMCGVKAAAVQAQALRHAEVRRLMFGDTVQPVDRPV